MRFSRHSKNRIRKAGLTQQEVKLAYLSHERVGTDSAGNPIAEIRVGTKLLHLVVALDDPGFVITLIEKRK